MMAGVKADHPGDGDDGRWAFVLLGEITTSASYILVYKLWWINTSSVSFAHPLAKALKSGFPKIAFIAGGQNRRSPMIEIQRGGTVTGSRTRTSRH